MMSGNNIFIDSNRVPAIKFISEDHNGAELPSYVRSFDEKTCCLWHASRIAKGGMMWHAILSVIANSDRPQEERDTGEQFLHEAEDIELLGFFEVYYKENADRLIAAFNITAMLLFSYVPKWTEIRVAIVSRDMKNSSILERLVQVLQVLQIRTLRNTDTLFTLPVNDTAHVCHAMQAGGWTFTWQNEH